MSPAAEPQRIESVRNGNREAVVVSDVLALFLLTEPYDAGVVSAFNRCRDVVKPHVTFFRTHKVVRPRRVADFAFDVLDGWLESPPDSRDSLKLELTSGRSADEIGDYSLRLYLPGNAPEFEAGYLQLGLPMSVALSDPDAVRELTLDVIRPLPIQWARTGFAIEYNIMRFPPERDRQMAAWCARYRCIDHRDPDRLAECARDCLGGIGWLTAVNKALVDAALDDDAQKALAQDASSFRDDVYLLTAGERPILGDVNRGEDLSSYRRVHHLVEDLYCDKCPPPPGLDDEGAWLRAQRFD